MSVGIGKKSNNYADQVLAIDAPKTVWMAIAYSFALRIVEGDPIKALELVREEWQVLHDNGIVPQKVRVESRS